jgi:hypothetical protein
MPEAMPFPVVEVVAVVITRSGQLLTLFNKRWGAFTLPLTKRRTWTEQPRTDQLTGETWQEAATRAAAEALGQPLPRSHLPRELPDVSVQPFQHSGRERRWKYYSFRVFSLPLGADELADRLTVAQPVDGAPVAWLTASQVLSFHPISPTAIRVVEGVLSSPHAELLAPQPGSPPLPPATGITTKPG